MHCLSFLAWRNAMSSNACRMGWCATSSSAARMLANGSRSTRKRRSSSCASLGNVDGFIVNEILGGDDDLRLRFSFALQLLDAPSDSLEEHEFRQNMERDYLKAVAATLGAIRKMAADPQNARLGGGIMKHWFSDIYADNDAMRLDRFALEIDRQIGERSDYGVSGQATSSPGPRSFWSIDRDGNEGNRHSRVWKSECSQA